MPSLKGPKQHGPPETGLGHGVGLCLLPASPGLSIQQETGPNAVLELSV